VLSATRLLVDAEASASNSASGTNPSELRSFSPMPRRAVSTALVSSLLTMRPTAASHGCSSMAKARLFPRALRLHCGTGTAGST
jgi:hypothetical protein